MRFPRFRPIPVPIHQFANQLVFLAVGKVFYRLSVTWVEIGLILLVSLLIEHTLIALRERRVPAFSPAAMSTGFNLAFMLGTTAFPIYAVGLGVGLGQKHLAKWRFGAHFQNPSNVAIVVALLAFPDYTYVTFLDWGRAGWLSLLIPALGMLLLQRLRLNALPFVFLGAWAVLQLLFVTRDLDTLLLHASSIAFLLFAFFMVTDPRTLPATTGFRAVYASSVALFATLLAAVLGPKDVNLFLALFLGGLFVPLWRRLEAGVPRLRTRALTAATVGLAVLTIAAYLSPWNPTRNALRSLAELDAGLGQTLLAPLEDIADAFLDEDVEPHRPAPVTDAVLLWSDADADAYRTSWGSGSVVRRPLAPSAVSGPAGELRFLEQSHRLPAYPSTITVATLGEESRMFASLAAGDVNHDGWLDVALFKLDQGMRLWINDRQGGFSDATGLLFDGAPPFSVESGVLADLNNDSWLDLLVIHSPYFGRHPATIWFFDPVRRRFAPSGLSLAEATHSSGGIAVHDLNQDRIPDFYFSFGLDWYSEKEFVQSYDTRRDMLFVSGRGRSGPVWNDRLSRYFEPAVAGQSFVGMTALFFDYDQDGFADFLLGNDFEDPSITARGTPDGRFALVPAASLENNTINSMTYIPVDFDNDGEFELWENGIAEDYTAIRRALTKAPADSDRSLFNREIAWLERQKEFTKLDCGSARHPVVRSICFDWLHLNVANIRGDLELCKRIVAVGTRVACRNVVQLPKQPGRVPRPDRFRYDVEVFPKQLKENVLLKRDGDAWKNVLKGNKEAQFTGFTWAGYPFDVDNDGLQDLYVTTGMLMRSSDPNRLLLNRSGDGTIAFTDAARAWGVDALDESRGAILADFDRDGDGDLFLNNFLAEPAYYENRHGGRSLAVELRSRTGNYYGLGATVRLVTRGGVQVRPMILGGIWNTGQPPVVHFGLAAGDDPERLEIRWPSGVRTRHAEVEAGFHYIVYE